MDSVKLSVLLAVHVYVGWGVRCYFCLWFVVYLGGCVFIHCLGFLWFFACSFGLIFFSSQFVFGLFVLLCGGFF